MKPTVVAWRRPKHALAPALAPLTLGLLLGAAACDHASGPDAALSTPKFDSSTSIALDAAIDGSVVTDSFEDGAARGQALEQLRYAIGQLNGAGGGIDTAHASISLTRKAPLRDGHFIVSYSAHALVSWPRSVAVPATYQLRLPVDGTWAGLASFQQTFGADEASAKACLSGDAHDVSNGNFWYYYRPLQRSCPLHEGASPWLRTTTMHLAVSGENTEGKAPEYDKVWEDGRLVITGVFSKYTDGATADDDIGIASYRRAYQGLITAFGTPASTTLPEGQAPSAVNTEIRMMFDSANGPIDVALFLVDTVAGAGPAFVESYDARTETSDLVAYSGHSGLGANIAALTRLGRYTAGQYQVFLLNGCDTFSYVDDHLRQAHADVNGRGTGLDKYVDIITNARPSPFSAMPQALVVTAKALSEKAATYRQILAGFGTSQRAAVTGEQDNRWPAPFED